MARKITKTNTTGADFTHESNLLRGLRDIFEPLIAALDNKPALLASADADTGHEAPSTQDIGLKILLGQTIQNLWRQQYGLIKTKRTFRNVKMSDGSWKQVENFSTIMNNDQRLKKSQDDVQYLQDEISGNRVSMTSKQALTTLHYFEVNEARFNATSELLGAYTTFYREVFKEDWKSSEEPANKEETKKIEIAPEENSRLVALMERITSRNVSRASAVEDEIVSQQRSA